MKAALRLEIIGDNTHQAFIASCDALDAAKPGLGRQVIGRPKARHWVAKILGPHAIYKYNREFLPSKKSYENANSVGSRGVEAIFVLESGNVYEISSPESWKTTRRYFARVTESGDICEIAEGEIFGWLDQANGRSD